MYKYQNNVHLHSVDKINVLSTNEGYSWSEEEKFCGVTGKLENSKEDRRRLFILQ